MLRGRTPIRSFCTKVGISTSGLGAVLSEWKHIPVTRTVLYISPNPHPVIPAWQNASDVERILGHPKLLYHPVRQEALQPEPGGLLCLSPQAVRHFTNSTMKDEAISTIDIDSIGDVSLELSYPDGDIHLTLASKTLTLVSPVFAAMFNSEFKEGLSNRAVSRRDPISLPDEDGPAFVVLCAATHYQMDKIPTLRSVPPPTKKMTEEDEEDDEEEEEEEETT